MKQIVYVNHVLANSESEYEAWVEEEIQADMQFKQECLEESRRGKNELYPEMWAELKSRIENDFAEFMSYGNKNGYDFYSKLMPIVQEVEDEVIKRHGYQMIC